MPTSIQERGDVIANFWQLVGKTHVVFAKIECSLWEERGHPCPHPYIRKRLINFAAESITTRPAIEADRDLLWRIFRDSMRDSITAARDGNWDEQRERKQFFDQLDLNCTQMVLIDGTGGRQPAGFFMTPEVDGYLTLHTICIDAPFRNAGLGALIVARLQSAAARTGVALRLSVLKANPGARRLYERLGFAVHSETDHHIHMEWFPA